MDFKLFITGLIFLIVGFLMYFNVRKRKPASKETNWEGQLMPQFIGFWMYAIISIIVGMIFLLKSL